MRPHDPGSAADPVRPRGQRGQTFSEYAIILVGLAVICIAIVVLFGGKIARLFGFAHDEVATMGEADIAPLDGPEEPADHTGGSEGSGTGGSDSDSGPATGGGGPDGVADEGGAAGGGGGRAGGGSQRGSGGHGAGGEGGDDLLIQPSGRPQRGTYDLERGDGRVTVVAAREDGFERGGQGSAAWDRQRDAEAQARARTEDQQRWQQRRRERIAEDAEEAESRKGGGGVLGMIRYLLIAILLGGGIFLGRAVLAGRGGEKEG